MKLIASIIVNNSSKSVDKEFDYLIPIEFEQLISVGMRVIVPFGYGNKTLEGYIISIHEAPQNTDIKYKYILDICDEEINLDEEMINTAYFIRDTCHCTLNEAIRAMVPSGTAVFENIQIKLLKSNYSVKQRRLEQILGSLHTEDYISYKKLCDVLSKKIKRADLYYLESLELIEIKKEFEQNITIKKEIVYEIQQVEAGIEFIKNYPPKLLKQAEVLKGIMNEKLPLTASEICEKFSCSSGVVKALVLKEYLVKSQREIYRDPFKQSYSYEKVELTEDQKRAIDNIRLNYQKGKNISLLYGVTGCGKTEIYLNLIEEFIHKECGSIIMVPEISLTPQTVQRFKGRFGDVVAVIHSRLSEGEKYDQWRRIKSGEVKVVVGARSAVFAPLKNLKIIILDEEHEYSYKSESSPRYDTREIAEFRISKNNGLLLLGSATPSLESYYKAERGIYNLIEIDKRINNIPLPEVKIIDLREELKNGNKSMFSQELYTGIEQNLRRSEQTILFLNRRGHSTFVSCRACGYKVKCKHCEVTMTYHSGEDKLVCHYCSSELQLPRQCPVCASKYIKHFGIGTEKIEEEVKKRFPTARVLRMDMDTTRRKGEHERLYNAFKEKRGDILIGTQMISKGMDFSDVTLVGIIAADTSLNIPDFRAEERTFQLLSQVSGRAGRGEKPGKVIIQTYDPENYSILLASQHDYKGFYNYEIAHRKLLLSPPFSDILYVLMVCENNEELIKCSNNIENRFKTLKSTGEFEILGPAPCHISKIKNNYRYHIMFKGSVKKWYNNINELIAEETTKYNIKYIMDINPYNMI